MKIVVLSPSMSSQMRCDSANCRPPNPVPSIFSSNPAIERSRSTWTGRVGIVRYLLGFGFRCVTIMFLFFLIRKKCLAVGHCPLAGHWPGYTDLNNHKLRFGFTNSHDAAYPSSGYSHLLP